MSKLGRVLNRQKRGLNQIAMEPILALSGFGSDAILVFNSCSKEYCRSKKKQLQERIVSGKYQDVKDFDGYHTADVEFSNSYNGKFISRYNRATKRQLIKLGCEWRRRADDGFPSNSVKIIVHFSDGTWFLDTFNYDPKIENAIYL